MTKAPHSATAERIGSEFIFADLFWELGSAIDSSPGPGLTIFTNFVKCK